MSFNSWLKAYRDSIIRSMPWIEEYLLDAFNAGRKYEKKLQSRRKVKLNKETNCHEDSQA